MKKHNFILKKTIGKHLEGQKGIIFTFTDLEKVFDRVPREETPEGDVHCLPSKVCSAAEGSRRFNVDVWVEPMICLEHIHTYMFLILMDYYQMV